MSKNKSTPERTPGFYIVIPAGVWFDERLRPNSSRLYGILSALSNAEGYCWASDGYLGELLHQSERTVRELLRELSDCGHIWVDKQGQSRRIWITPPAGDFSPTGENPPEELAEIRQESGENPPENIKSNNNTPYNPPEGESVKPVRKKSASDIRAERELWFEKIYDLYPRHEDPGTALRAFLKLKPDRALAVRIYKAIERQKSSYDWQKENGKYVPKLNNWLAAEAWKNEPMKSRPPAYEDQDEWEYELV